MMNHQNLQCPVVSDQSLVGAEGESDVQHGNYNRLHFPLRYCCRLSCVACLREVALSDMPLFLEPAFFLAIFHSYWKMWACEVTMLPCVCPPPFQHMNQLISFHKIWHECYAIGVHPTL
jgi:hypothetical protein